MKIPKNKMAAITIAIFFILSMTASMILIPNASAHSPPWNIPTYAYLEVNPNPAGVGQTVNVGFWVNCPPPTASRSYGDRWQGLTVKVTKPDGTTETLGPFTSDDTGGTHTDFTPTALGNYTFVFTFPGQTLAGVNLDPTTGGAGDYPNIGDYYEPSTSPVYTLTVQQTPVPSVPENPLPTSFWSRPIESYNDYWYTISGNWLGLAASTFTYTGMYNASGNYNPYTTAPTTAHILWTQPGGFGGLVGGEFGDTDTSQFDAPLQYQPKFAPIIIDGILFYEQYPTAQSCPTAWIAVNLQTGKILWDVNTTESLMCGQLLDFVTPNQYGTSAYLWSESPTTPNGAPLVNGNGASTVLNPNAPPNTGTTYNMYDAMTGNYILSIVNGTAMTLTEDAGGDLIGYYVNNTAGTQIIQGKPVTTPLGGSMLECWNSTEAILYPYYGWQPGITKISWSWAPGMGHTKIPFKNGIMWAVPLATTLKGLAFPTTIVDLSPPGVTPGTFAYLPTYLSITSNCIEDGVVLMEDSAIGGTGSFNSGYTIEAGYSLTTGAQLWITNRTETENTRIVTLPATDGYFGEVNLDTGIMDGYSMTTGTQVWGPVTLPHYDSYDSIGGYQYVSANGICYLWSFGGNIYAVNMATGNIIWSTDTNTLSGLAGSNTPYGVWPLWTFTVGTVAGGMLFVPEGHQYSPPMFRGASELAVNCTNGQLVWSDVGFDVTSAPAVSDGIMIGFNDYDNQIYAYGMGPSETTVSAPDIGVTTATPVTITGTVMDMSPGAQQTPVAANFPHGLPCVSDASMTQFMEAVYQQEPMPSNITGVPVQIAVLDSNGNHYPIGTVTTDASGFYSLHWTPIIPGNYTVYATFAGTQSYYGSYAEAAFYASTPAPTAAPAASPPTGLASTGTVELGIAAVIIVIVICVAVLAVLMLRRRP